MTSLKGRKSIYTLLIPALILSLVAAAIVPTPPPVAAASDDWEWQNPLPQGNSLHGVWVKSPNDVFAVGELGTILYYNGSSWFSMSSPTA